MRTYTIYDSYNEAIKPDISFYEKEANPYAKRWVNELESTDKEQGKNHLHAISFDGLQSFCCLGIACDLFLPGLVLKSTPNASTQYMYEGETQWLPASMVDKLGIRKRGQIQSSPYEGDSLLSITVAPRVINQNLLSLTQLNDQIGMDFKEIAHFIKNYFFLLMIKNEDF